MNVAIAAQIQKQMSYANFVAWDQVDDQGGYFGTEFEIRSNAGRIKSLYAREPWVWASATLVARTLAQVPLKVYKNNTDQEMPGHPLNAILAQGTPTLSAFATRWVLGLDIMLGGNSMLILEPDMKRVAGIAPVELVNFVYSQDATRIEYVDVYAFGNTMKAARFPYSQCIHNKYPNPFNPYYGISPFIAAARPLLVDRYASEFDMAFYLRGGTSTGVIETTEELSKSRFQRLMRTFEAAFTGRSNWWRTLFLPKGTTWKPAGLTMAEAQHLDKLRDNRNVILATIGIPPSMVGLVQDVNRATAEQQERSMWSNLMVPMAMFIADGWNGSALVRDTYKGQVQVKADFSGIEAVQGFASMLGERAKSMEPYFLIDEIRAEVWRKEPLPDGLGQRFVAEVRPVPTAPTLALTQPTVATRAIAIPDGFEVQCLRFLKAQFDVTKAQDWCRMHGYKAGPVTETQDSWCVEQTPADLFDRETMKDIILEDAVNATIGTRKSPEDKSNKKAAFQRLKATAVTSQNRVEAKLGNDLERAIDKYTEALIVAAKSALEKRTDVRSALASRKHEREELWTRDALPVLVTAMDRGFSMALSQVKALVNVTEKADVKPGFPAINETDRQAVDVLRERSRNGKRATLEARAIKRFVGLDATKTEQVMQVIEDGERAGKTFEEIARTIREDFGEAYRNQARTIVRTEILTAVSEGLAWNHEVLGQVFSKVQKQWVHQGDGGINPDAREEHAALEDTLLSGDEAWHVVDAKTGDTYELRYPRDPSGPASGIINCRCSMVTVIPDDATSNADAILE
jgi:HK97 family phage portal protein